MSQPQEIAGLLVVGDADLSPAEQKLTRFERRIEDSAEKIEKSYQNVGSKAFQGMEQGVQRLTRQIPIIGQPLAFVEQKVFSVRQAFLTAGESAATAMRSAQREVELLGTKVTAAQQKIAALQSKRSGISSNFDAGVSDLTRGVSRRVGANIDADFLKQLNGASSEMERIDLIAQKMGRDDAALVNTIDSAAVSYGKLGRGAESALAGVDKEIASAGSQLSTLTADSESATGALAGMAAGGEGLLAVLGPIGIAIGVIVALEAAVVIGTAAAIAVMFKLGDAAAATDTKLFDLSRKLNLSTETLSALKVAAQDSGTSLESITASLGIFDKNIELAAEGNKKLRAEFRLLKIDTNDGEKALKDAFAALNKMPPGYQQTALAMRLFGRSGKEMLGIVKESQGDFDAYTKQLGKLGLVVHGKAVSDADEYRKSLNRLDQVFEGLKRRVGEEFFPVLSDALKQLTQFIAENGDQMTEWARSIADAVNALGGLPGVIERITNELFPMIKPLADLYYYSNKLRADAREYDQGGVSVRDHDGREHSVPKGVDPIEWARLENVRNDTDPESLRSDEIVKKRKGSFDPKELAGGGGRRGGESKAMSAAREAVAGLEIIRQAEDRIYQQRTADEEFFYSNGLKALSSYVYARHTLEDEHLKNELVVANKELAIAQSIPGNSQKKQNEVAKAEEKISAIYAKAQANNTQVDRDAGLKQLQAQKQAWDDKVSLLQETESGYEAVYNSMAEHGVMSFRRAQDLIAGLQEEILLAQKKGIEKQLKNFKPGTDQANALTAQLDQIKQHIENFHSQVGIADADADQKDYERDQTRLKQIRDFNRESEDLAAQSQESIFQVLEKSSKDKQAVWKRELDFESRQESVRAQHIIDDLQRQRDDTEKWVAVEQGREQRIAAIDARITAERQSSAAKQQQILEDFYQKENGRLEALADKAVGVLDNALQSLRQDGFKGFFRSLEEDFLQMILKWQEDLLKSKLLTLLQQITHTPAPGSTVTGSSTPQSSSPGAGIDVGSIFNGFIHKIFGGGSSTHTSSQSADATAVSAAGKEATGAIKEGWTNSVGKITQTGDKQAGVLTSVGQSIVGTMLQIANIIAAGNGRGSFWKGLGMAALSGFLSGLTSGLTNGLFNHSSNSSSDGQGDVGGGISGGQTGAAIGGLLKGPGTPTSDSILGIDPRSGLATAWVSAGEYVIKGSAVSKLGVGVLDYINRMGELPRSAMMNLGSMPALAGGGGVTGYVPPAYNSSTSNDNSRNVTVHQEMHFNINGDVQSEKTARKTGRQIARASRNALASLTN
jgi:hypothetical protein